MLICSCGYGAAQLWFAYASTEPEILAARMFAGLFTGGVFTSFLTYVVNVSARKDIGKNLTISAAIQSVASAFGYMIGGFLGEVSVRLTFLVQAVTLIACGFLFFVICLPDSEMNFKEVSPSRLLKEANPLQAILDSRYFMSAAFALLFAVNLLVNFGFTGFDQAFNYYLKDGLGLTSSYNGMIKAVVGIMAFVSNMTLCIWIMKRKDRNQLTVLVIAACAAGALGSVLTVNAAPLIGYGLLLFGAYFVSVPLIQDMVAKEAKEEQKNLVMGFYNATKNIGGMAGSLTAGMIYSVHAKLPFWCMFVVLLAAAVVMAVYAGRRKDGYLKAAQ